MNRDVRLYVDDIAAAITQIGNYTRGISRDHFLAEPMIQDAVIRQLEVIGEAVVHLPAEIRALYPSIPWRQITGMRNRLIHEYFGVLIDRVWEVVVSDLPPIEAAIKEIQRSM